MKKKTRKYIIGLLFLALILLVFWHFTSGGKEQNYEEETARTQDIETFYTFSGNVEADSFKVISATSRGTVREWKFEEGDSVEKDKVVMISKSGSQIKTTMAGTISDIYVDVGDDYTIGDALFRIADYAHPLIKIKVDEYDVSAISKDMQVEVKVQATGQLLNGTVRRIAQEATVSNDLAYYEAIIDLPQDGNLMMGLTCEVIVPREHVKNATTVTIDAIQYDDNGKPFVYCYNRNNEIIQQSVLLGINDGNIVEIRDGLRTGETVLLPASGDLPFPMMPMMQSR